MKNLLHIHTINEQIDRLHYSFKFKIEKKKRKKPFDKVPIFTSVDLIKKNG